MALAASRRPAHERLELDAEALRARKHDAMTLDLSGIAKGYGVDRLTEVAHAFGIPAALLSIDASWGVWLRPDGTPGPSP